MFIVKYVTDKGTRQSEPVTTIESARYLRAEILTHQKPQEVEILAILPGGSPTAIITPPQPKPTDDNDRA